MRPMNDMPRMLAAIASVESSGGENDYPRFEAAYAPKDKTFTIQGRIVVGTGKNFTAVARARWAKYGMASACSYSRWQILYHAAADLGFDRHPVVLWNYPEIAQHWVEAFLRRHIAKGATTVEQLADAYNSGNSFDQIIPEDYIDKVVKAWDLFDEALRT